MHEPNQVMQAASIISRIMAVAHNHVQDYQVIIPKALLKQARNTRRIFNVVLGTIAAIALVAGGIGVMNITLATVSDEREEHSRS